MPADRSAAKSPVAGEPGGAATSPGSSAASIFDAFPEVARSALWPLLGGGLDDKGKEVWLACERIDGYSDEEIFAHAIRDMNGMVAT